MRAVPLPLPLPLLAALAIFACAPPPAAALEATSVSVHPSLLPDRLGASTAFTLALRFSGGEEGVPAPVRTIVLQLPAGLEIDLRGVGTCPRSELQRAGAADCPSASLLGRGHAELEVHAGSQTIPEPAVIWVFRAPNRSGRTMLEILSRGDTPLQQQTISTAVILHGEGRPYGSELSVSIPPIPTVVYEPDASFVSLSLSIGRAGVITVPHSCPAGGFPFAAAVSFAEGPTAAASTDVPCP
jgi:hypothetical protein